MDQRNLPNNNNKNMNDSSNQINPQLNTFDLEAALNNGSNYDINNIYKIFLNLCFYTNLIVILTGWRENFWEGGYTNAAAFAERRCGSDHRGIRNAIA